MNFDLKKFRNGHKAHSKKYGYVKNAFETGSSMDDKKLCITFEGGEALLYSLDGRLFIGSVSDSDVKMEVFQKKGFINIYPALKTSDGNTTFTVGDCERVFDSFSEARQFGIRMYKTEKFLTIPIDFTYSF